MPAPTKVNPSNFPDAQVVYNEANFSIAWGTWEGKRKCLGMRWNGGAKDPGYPKLFKNPVWFVLPDELSKPIVKALLGEKGSKNEKLLRVLNRLRKPRAK